MPSPSHRDLKTIRFEGELLPDWAQLLDVASRLCPVSEESRDWFSTFTQSSGVDDACTVRERCGELRSSLRTAREAILAELNRAPGDDQPCVIFGAWMYALDTMIQQAEGKKATCAWRIEGIEENDDGPSDGGEISLRRV